jgi:predicted ester cyclase
MSTTAATTVTSLDGFHATPTAQQADALARALFDAVNADDPARTDAVLARSFLSYDAHGTRSRTGLRRYHSDLRRSFPDIRFQVHENIGVLVEGDLVALRTIITGTHTGHYADVAPTGRPVQTSASHIFRVRDDQFTEHWQATDTYRILAAIGAIPGVANVFQKQVLGVPESPGGLFAERPGTDFGRPAGRRVTREESRAVVRRLYDGVISTGRAEDADMVAEDYIQNSGWTPDGRAGQEGNRALGILGAIAGARGLLLAAGAACGVLVRAATAGPVRPAARRCRSHDRCPRRACTEILERYP